MKLTRILFYAISLMVLTVGIAPAVSAETIYGIQSSSNSALATVTGLTRFDSATPQTQTFIGQFTGVVAGQTVRSIDSRPQTGVVYAVSTTSGGTAGQLYTVNVNTAALTPVGSGFTLSAPPVPTGTTIDLVEIEFNPVTDQIRLLTGANVNAGGSTVPNNYILDPNTGALTVQTNLNYVPGDANGGNQSISITAAAYSNPSAGATTAYVFDYSTDTFARLGSPGGTPDSPSTGRLSSIFKPAAPFTGGAGQGMDFGPSGTLYMTRDSAAGVSGLYMINPSTGAQTLIGNYPTGVFITDITVNRALTAAGVEVSGRVTTDGRTGLRGATVTMTDNSGNTRTATTGLRGSFSFEDVEIGQTYTVMVNARRYTFQPQVISVTDSVSTVSFIADNGRVRQR